MTKEIIFTGLKADGTGSFNVIRQSSSDGRVFVRVVGEKNEQLNNAINYSSLSEDDFDRQLCRIKVWNQEGKVGFVSREGKMKILPQYLNSTSFQLDAFALVQLENGNWVIIDRKGRKLSEEFNLVDPKEISISVRISSEGGGTIDVPL